MTPEEILNGMIQSPGKYYTLSNSKPNADWRRKWWSYEGNIFKCMTAGDADIFDGGQDYPERDKALEQLSSDLIEALPQT